MVTYALSSLKKCFSFNPWSQNDGCRCSNRFKVVVPHFWAPMMKRSGYGRGCFDADDADSAVTATANNAR